MVLITATFMVYYARPYGKLINAFSNMFHYINNPENVFFNI